MAIEQNHVKTGVLLAVVLAVWLFAFRGLYNAVVAEPVLDQNAHTILPEFIATETVQVEYTIRTDHRDPFLGNPKRVKRNPVRQSKSNGIVNTPLTVKEKKGPKAATPIKWPAIVYKGFIQESNSTGTAVLEIKGKEFTVRVGEELEEVKVNWIGSDSIQLEYKNESNYFKEF